MRKKIVFAALATGIVGFYLFLHKPAPCNDDVTVCPNGMLPHILVRCF